MDARERQIVEWLRDIEKAGIEKARRRHAEMMPEEGVPLFKDVREMMSLMEEIELAGAIARKIEAGAHRKGRTE